MSELEAVVRSLRRALLVTPDDGDLRTHLADCLLRLGRHDEAATEAAVVVGSDPSHAAARRVLREALDRSTTEVAVDWEAWEQDLRDSDRASPLTTDDPEPAAPDRWGIESTGVSLADVGGLGSVKKRLEAAFLAPMRHPDLRRAYGKSLRGGLLLYGPPGCGKTFVARAVAGELGARFLSVGLADILDRWLGASEQNVHDLFQAARRAAPVVVFLDEIDALGQKRWATSAAGTRGVVNQLLTELDGVVASNEGVFVLAATNQPWDVDPALRRPGRLDRMLLVAPPDGPAREAILRTHLEGRPIDAIDVGKLAKVTSGFSGADLAHVCESAAESALLDSVETGEVRMITTDDLLAARREITPSTDDWFVIARNVVTFGDTRGTYAELRAYMKSARLL